MKKRRIITLVLSILIFCSCIISAKAEIVTFETYGGTAIEPQVVESGETATTPTDPIKDGYRFDGWYDSDEYSHTFDFSTPITSNTTIYAKWEEDRVIRNVDISILDISYYFVTSNTEDYVSARVIENSSVPNDAHYSIGSGTGIERSDANLLSGRMKTDMNYSYVFKIVAEDGYTFANDVAVTINGEAKTPNDLYDTYFYVRMAAPSVVDNSQYAVRFYPNGGSDVETQIIVNGNLAEEPEVSRTGFQLEGWYENSDFTGDKFNFSTPITKDTTLYAKWLVPMAYGTTDGGSYKVSTANDEPITGSMNTYLLENQSVTLTAIPDEGYEFVGWYVGVVGDSHFIEDNTDELVYAGTPWTFTPDRGMNLRAVFSPTTVPVEDYAATLYDIDLGKASVGYKTRDYQKTINMVKTGTASLALDLVKVELTDGDIDAFVVTQRNGGVMDTIGGRYDVATIEPKAGLEVGTYTATMTLYHDTDNDGNWDALATAEVTIEIAEPEDLPFADTKKGAWYYESVRGAYNRGIIKGYDNGKFGINDKITRGQLVVILYRLEGETDVSSLDNPFEDVAEGKYYTDAIKWAYANHIVNGYTATTFGPTDNIKRKDFAVILNNYAKYKSLDVSSSIDLTNFADYYKVEGNYAEPALKWAAANKIISGAEKDGKRYLNPNNNATRAEAAAMIMNFINKYSL